jgi:5-methylcytosine-specific restriction endonuclease McrA
MEWLVAGVLVLLVLAFASHFRTSPSSDRLADRERPASRSASPRALSTTEFQRRARIGGYYPGWWGSLLREHDYKCAYCGRYGDHGRVRLHKDHEVPLVRGGPHHISNIVPACAPCNLIKGPLTGDEFRALIHANGGVVPPSRARSKTTARKPLLREVILKAVAQLATTTDAEDWSVSQIIDGVRASGCTAPLASLRATISTMGSTGLLARTGRGRYRLPD